MTHKFIEGVLLKSPIDLRENLLRIYQELAHHMCLVFKDPEENNEPMQLVSFDEWNSVIDIVFRIGVVRCQERD